MVSFLVRWKVWTTCLFYNDTFVYYYLHCDANYYLWYHIFLYSLSQQKITQNWVTCIITKKRVIWLHILFLVSEYLSIVHISSLDYFIPQGFNKDEQCICHEIIWCHYAASLHDAQCRIFECCKIHSHLNYLSANSGSLSINSRRTFTIQMDHIWDMFDDFTIYCI